MGPWKCSMHFFSPGIFSSRLFKYFYLSRGKNFKSFIKMLSSMQLRISFSILRPLRDPLFKPGTSGRGKTAAAVTVYVSMRVLFYLFYFFLYKRVGILMGIPGIQAFATVQSLRKCSGPGKTGRKGGSERLNRLRRKEALSSCWMSASFPFVLL